MNDETATPTPEAGTPTREAIVEVLKSIEDPELFLDIWFLGLIYTIGINEGKIVIEMTFTSPMCPAGPWLMDQVKSKVGSVPGVESVEVQVTFTPPWQPSDDVKAMLGML